MECCGEDRTGKFCSECGSALISGSIAGFLRHIEVQIKKLTNKTNKYGKDEMSRGRDIEERSLKKWTSWRDEVIRLIELDNKITEESTT